MQVDAMINNISTKTVGIFDSGVGGLSVLREIHALLPAQPLYYIADQAHVPYGKRKLSEIRDFSFAITDFFISIGIQIVVVACNTASAAALNDLREEYPQLTFIGMEPAVKPASQKTHNGNVGVLATPATFQGKLYNTLVEKFAKDVNIFTNTCPGLVEAIEAGKLSNHSTKTILKEVLLPMIEKGVDTIVLGCTHFPFVVPAIKDIVGPNIGVIDPSPAIAKRVSSLLNKLDLIEKRSLNSDITYATSGELENFSNTVYSLLNSDISPKQIKWADGKIKVIN
jgi:glutamate racemase